VNKLADGSAYISLLPIIEPSSSGTGFQFSCVKIANRVLQLTDSDTKYIRNPIRQKYVNGIISIILKVLSTIGTKVAEKRYSQIVDNVSELFLSIIVASMKEGNQIFQEQLDIILLDSMDYFEYVCESLFKEYSDLNSNAQSKMPDYITTLGLHAIKLNKGTFAETAIDILSRLSLHVIQFDKSEYSATRIAVRILHDRGLRNGKR